VAFPQHRHGFLGQPAQLPKKAAVAAVFDLPL
jgi:hypothetical protein